MHPYKRTTSHVRIIYTCNILIYLFTMNFNVLHYNTMHYTQRSASQLRALQDSTRLDWTRPTRLDETSKQAQINN